MTNDDIIRLANEARLCGCKWVDDDDDRDVESLYDFVALVAAAEREACAKVCDDIDEEFAERGRATWCSAAIRARSNHDKLD
jgi:hypothetical protein